ncbi:MAG: ABC transporter [Actinomycetota bacterium]
MSSSSAPSALLDALHQLRDRLGGCRLSLRIAGRDRVRRVRDELVGQIEDYLLPRLRALDAPLLVVLGGSTGGGKSTIANSLVGAPLSPAGVLRPTTRAPILICNPGELDRFGDERILPGLVRTTGAPGGDDAALRVIAHDAVPSGLALLDAPDIDSVVESNRELAGQLLAAADLWLFVTTAARYADAVPWELLHKAQARSTAVALVLNRVPGEALDDVPRHLEEMLVANGLGAAQVFVVPETTLERGMIPPAQLASVRAWLERLGADAEARAAVIRTTLEGALGSIEERVGTVTSHVDTEVATLASLTGLVLGSYERAARDVEEDLSGGALLRGEVLARWQEVVGTGDLMRSLESRIGWLRDRIRRSLMGEPGSAAEVTTALGSSVETVVVAAAERAAERSAAAWRDAPAGRPLLEPLGASLDRSSPRFARALGDEVRSWQQRVLELVRDEGAAKRATGRALSFGVNAVGAALMIMVFAQTGGLTGAEIAVAGGTATVSQKLLEALFGDQAVRTLTAAARADLLERVDRLLTAEADRFGALLEPLAPGPEEARELRRAAEAVGAARL